MATPKRYTTAAGKRAAIERAQRALSEDAWSLRHVDPSSSSDILRGVEVLERSIAHLRAVLAADVRPRGS